MGPSALPLVTMPAYKVYQEAIPRLIAEAVRQRVHAKADTGSCVVQVEAVGSLAAHERTGERVTLT